MDIECDNFMSVLEVKEYGLIDEVFIKRLQIERGVNMFKYEEK